MKKYIGVVMGVIMSSVWATDFTCPSTSEVMQAKFIHAIQNSYDHDCWELISNTFNHDEKTWMISFGSFFPDIKSEAEVLKAGQNYFSKITLDITHPEPIEIPKHYICIYVPNGRPYWVSALTEKK